MKIVTPIANVSEVEILSRAGAQEFYCRFVPDEWIGQFCATNLNRHPSDYFQRHSDLARAVHIAHQNACSISLVLNTQSYSAKQLNAVISLAESFLDMGGDALIVSDFGLVWELLNYVPLKRIHVSAVAASKAHSSARFCKELGVCRVILPRDVSVAEACGIAAEIPSLEIEAFILDDECVFEGGACSTLNSSQYLDELICMNDCMSHCEIRGGGDRISKIFREKDRDYKQWLWYRYSYEFAINEIGMFLGRCDLEALPALQKSGVTAVKIAGMGAPTVKKLESVQMVRAVMDRIEAGDSCEQVMQFTQELRASVEHCKRGHSYYYPEVLKH